MADVLCEFEGCGRKANVKGLCLAHYKQRRNGNQLRPLYSTIRRPHTLPVVKYRIVTCLVPNLVGPCHVYLGGKNPKGYGQIWVCGRLQGVHRYVWELANGKLEEGKEIDHICRVRACCNVLHLRAVTHKTNLLENSETFAAKNKAKTQCIRGHPFDSTNTGRTCRGGRRCLTCHREREAKRYKNAKKQCV